MTLSTKPETRRQKRTWNEKPSASRSREQKATEEEEETQQQQTTATHMRASENAHCFAEKSSAKALFISDYYSFSRNAEAEVN